MINFFKRSFKSLPITTIAFFLCSVATAVQIYKGSTGGAILAFGFALFNIVALILMDRWDKRIEQAKEKARTKELVTAPSTPAPNPNSDSHTAFADSGGARWEATYELEDTVHSGYYFVNWKVRDVANGFTMNGRAMEKTVEFAYSEARRAATEAAEAKNFMRNAPSKEML